MVFLGAPSMWLLLWLTLALAHEQGHRHSNGINCPHQHTSTEQSESEHRRFERRQRKRNPVGGDRGGNRQHATPKASLHAMKPEVLPVGVRGSQKQATSTSSSSTTSSRSFIQQQQQQTSWCIQCVTIPLYVHVVEDEAGESDGARLFSDFALDAQVRDVNELFIATPFQFDLKEVLRYQNDTWNAAGEELFQTDLDIGREITTDHRVGGSNVLNMFVSTGICEPYWGFYWGFPLREFGMFPENQATWRDVIWLCDYTISNAYGWGEQYLLNIWAHEIGHWLGLFHTYHGESCNDPNHNDFVLDTPRVGNTMHNESCPIGQDTCPNDEEGPDDVTNYMELFYSCANHFTTGQIERMWTFYNDYRERIAACDDDEANVIIEVKYDSNAEQNAAIEYRSYGSDGPWESLAIDQGRNGPVDLTNQVVGRNLCIPRHNVHALAIVDNGRDGILEDGYISITMNGRELTKTGDFGGKSQFITYYAGDSSSCLSNQGRFSLDLQFASDAAENIQWRVVALDSSIVTDYTATLFQGLDSYGSQFWGRWLYFDMCLSEGGYFFVIEDVSGSNVFDGVTSFQVSLDGAEIATSNNNAAQAVVHAFTVGSAPITSSPIALPPVSSAPQTLTPVTADPTTSSSTSGPVSMSPIITVLTTSSPTTSEPTTAAPTTSSPTTEPTIAPVSVTPVPTTSSPTTSEPTTAAPTTSSPTTEPTIAPVPVTPVPTTSSPTSSEPTTAAPTTSSPTTEPTIAPVPVTPVPTTSSPTTSEPTTAAPTTSLPTTEPTKAPVSTSFPVTPEPTTSEPTTPPPPLCPDGLFFIPSLGCLCFPGSSTVHVRNLGTVLLRDLKLGDHVLVASAPATYEPVMSFGHYLPHQMGTFVKITTSSGTIQISALHMIELYNKRTFVPAGSVQKGDVLVYNGGVSSPVLSIRKDVSLKGLYAPFTPSGTIMVDGFSASCYVAFDEASPTLKTIMGIQVSFHWLAHSFETFHRISCHYMGPCITEEYTQQGMSTWVEFPLKVSTRVLMMKNELVKNFLFGIAIVLLGLMRAVEFCFLQNCGIVVMLLLPMLCARLTYYKRRK